MDRVNAVSGGNDVKIDVTFKETESIMRMTLAYYLSEEIVQGNHIISAPDLFSDEEMLEWLWRRGLMEVGGRLNGVATLLPLEEDNVGVSVVLPGDVPARRKSEIRELVLFALVSSMAKDWLFIANKKDVAYFEEWIQSAVATVIWIVMQSEGKINMRRPCSPF